jgi:hypothetical protein
MNYHNQRIAEIMADFTPPEVITEELIEKNLDGQTIKSTITLLGLRTRKPDFYLKNLRIDIKKARYCLKSFKFQLRWYETEPDHLRAVELKTGIYILEKALNIENVKLRHEQLREIRRQERNPRQQTAVKSNFSNSDNLIFAYVH